MQKLNKFIIILALIGFKVIVLHAQTTILDETLLTPSSFNNFTPVTVTGLQGWSFSPQYGAMCSGYAGGQSNENEDWLISPVMNLAGLENVQLTLNHTRGSAGVMNAGVEQGWYEVFATADYTGNPLTTQWIQLEGLNQNIPAAWQFIQSGSIVIPEAAKSESSRFAFRYISSAIVSATWEIKNVRLTTDSPVTPPELADFKITNWNTEWLGCVENGPTDENQQINNVVTAMLSMNSDIYCLQEVSNTVANPSIETLVSLLGSDQWGGAITPAYADDCTQRQGIIYKRAKVQLVNFSQLSTGSNEQGGSYNYNWSGGRYPALYTVNLIAGNALIPVSLVNIHAKAEDGLASSYTRRLGAAQALKTILDGTGYNTKNVILIGDFNDYLTGTTSTTCGCTVSPYNNFMTDGNYLGITNGLRTQSGNRPIIENIVISNELVNNYIGSSAARDVSLITTIDEYYDTTSDHLPVSARFQFSTLSTPAVNYSGTSLTVYPNPVTDELNIAVSGTVNEDAAIAIYDITGRQVFSQKTAANSINVSAFPAGIYIFKMGEKSAKFIKQ